MNIHEYQAKELLAKFGAPIAAGHAAFTVDEAVAAAGKLPGPLYVVKAQIHAGGRGKGKFKELGPDAKGGVRLAKTLDEVKAATRKFGPLAVSINSAPEPVLRAMLDAALLGDGVDRTLNTLMQARRSAAIDGAMTREEFQLALDSAGLEPPLKARVERVVTTQPIIWRFVVEPDVDPSSAGGASVRYEGLAIIAPPSADRGSNVPRGAGAVMELRKIEAGPQGGESESRTVTGAGGA